MDRFNFFLNLTDQILEIAVIMYKRDRRTMVARIEHRFELSSSKIADVESFDYSSINKFFT